MESLEWINKIKDAMVMLHENCSLNESWGNCYKCPFDEYCDAILHNGLGTPNEDDFINFE